MILWSSREKNAEMRKESGNIGKVVSKNGLWRSRIFICTPTRWRWKSPQPTSSCPSSR